MKMFFFLYLDSVNLDLVNEDKIKLSSKAAGNVIYIKVRNNTDVNGCFLKDKKNFSHFMVWVCRHPSVDTMISL